MSQDISDIDRYPRSGKFICMMLSLRRRDRGTVHHFYEIYFLISLLDFFVYFFWYASGIYVLLTTFKPFKYSTNVARNLQSWIKKENIVCSSQNNRKIITSTILLKNPEEIAGLQIHRNYTLSYNSTIHVHTIICVMIQ